MKLKLENIPGLSKLTRDYFSTFEKTGPFFNGHFQDCSSFKNIANRLQIVNRPHRNELADILIDQNRNFNAADATFQNIELLRQPDTLAVVSGQQAGLFGGPLFTIHKSLTAIKLANTLTQRLGRPVVPVFYLVSEDHDFEEIKSTTYIDKRNAVKSLTFEPETLPDRIPVAQIKLNDNILQLLETLDADLPDTEFKADWMQKLKSAYTSGEFLHIAFARWYQSLFAEYGIVLFDSSDSRVKPFLSDLFEKELREDVCNPAMQKTNNQLEKAGYHTQITVQSGRPNLFLLDNGRHGLQRKGDEFISLGDNRKYTLDELVAQPEKLSPKVSTRPIAQDILFPTVAYVGGPGEIAYWAQLKGIYDAMDMNMPVVYPRAAFTLIEPKIQKHLDAFGLTAEQVITDPEGVIKDVMQSRIPTDIREQFAALQSQLGEQLASLGTAAKEIEPTLQSAFEKTGGNMEKQIASLESRVLKAVEQREQVTRNQLESIVNHLMPEGGLQERKINILPFLVKYDTPLLRRIYDEIEIAKFEHKGIEL